MWTMHFTLLYRLVCFTSQLPQRQLSSHPLPSEVNLNSRPHFCPEQPLAHTAQGSPPTGVLHCLGCPSELPPPDTTPQLSLQLRCPAGGPAVAEWLRWAAVIISTRICCLLSSCWRKSPRGAEGSSLRAVTQGLTPLKLAVWVQAHAKAHSITLTSQVF